jgi:hypothetical protein
MNKIGAPVRLVAPVREFIGSGSSVVETTVRTQAAHAVFDRGAGLMHGRPFK